MIPKTFYDYQRLRRLLGKQPIMVMLFGQFPDAFGGKKRSEWPKLTRLGETLPPFCPEEEKTRNPSEEKRARLMAVGCAQMFTNNFITGGTHWLLVGNCLAAITLGEEFIGIRGKTSSDLSIRQRDLERIPRREGPDGYLGLPAPQVCRERRVALPQ